MVYLVGKGFSQYLQIKNIPDLQLRKVGEHLLTCHTAVCGQNAVGSIAAYRQRTAKQVTDAFFQGLCFCAMVDGQMDIDRGNVDIPHNAIPGDIQLILIILGCPQQSIVAKRITHLRSRLDCFIVGNGEFLCLADCAVIHLLHLFLILRVDLGLVLFIVNSADDRINCHAKRQQKSDNGNTYS